VRRSQIECEFAVFELDGDALMENFGEEVGPHPIEAFFTVRYLDTPPTLGGKEYVVGPLWGDTLTNHEILHGEKHRGELIRDVTWVPGFKPIYLMNPDLDARVKEHIQPWLNGHTMGTSLWSHEIDFLPGKGRKPESGTTCDARIALAVKNWDDSPEGQQHGRKGLGWWRHMEEERVLRKCSRADWMEAWAKWAEGEPERKAAKKKKDEAFAARMAKKKLADEQLAKDRAKSKAAQPAPVAPPLPQNLPPAAPAETPEAKRERLLQEAADAEKAAEKAAKEEAAALRALRGAKLSGKEKAQKAFEDSKKKKKQQGEASSSGQQERAAAAAAPEQQLPPPPRLDFDALAQAEADERADEERAFRPAGNARGKQRGRGNRR
jgi:hypothetical protein